MLIEAVPVRFVTVPLLGVPSAGVTRVGLVANTTEPEPVSSVKASARLAELNEPSSVALPVDVIAPVRLALVTTVAAFPTLVTPPVKFALVTTVAAFPTDVTIPVKLAFVVTLPAVKPAAVPVTLVIIPETGVPSAGAVSVLFERV
jgi:hypothetical protein